MLKQHAQLCDELGQVMCLLSLHHRASAHPVCLSQQQEAMNCHMVRVLLCHDQRLVPLCSSQGFVLLAR